MANPKYKRTSPEKKKQMCELYAEGQSATKIAKLLGCSKPTVLRVLEKSGIERRVRGHIHAVSKFCPDCSTEKPMSEFYGVNRGHVDCRCKTCRKAYAQKWKEENRERSRELGRDYADRNRGRWTEQSRAWERNNRDKLVASYARNKAKKLNLNGNFTGEEWLALCDKYGNLCQKCKSEGPLTVDHIIPFTKPGCTNDISNIQPLCHSCNSGKGARTIDFRPDFSCLVKGEQK